MRLLGRRQTGWVLFCWFLMVVCGCTETTASVSGASCTAPLLTTVPNAAVSRPVVVSPGQTLRILRVRIPDLPRYQRAAPGQPLHWSHRVCDPGSQSAAPGYRSRAYARRHLCHHYSCPFAAPARASHGTNLPASRRAHSSPDPLAAGLLARGSHAGSYCFYRRRFRNVTPRPLPPPASSIPTEPPTTTSGRLAAHLHAAGFASRAFRKWRQHDPERVYLYAK